MADGAVHAFAQIDAAAGSAHAGVAAPLTERAVAVLMNTLPMKLRLADAAHILGVHPRALEDAFAREGLTPRLHLRRLRLARVHADLASGRFDDARSVLVRWGFPGSGQDVLGDYRLLFGCSPEETRKTARVRRGSSV